MDPYAYVGENPESRTDPTGHYYTNGTPITQQGGAIGYIGNTTDHDRDQRWGRQCLDG